jgi:Zn-dependent protease
MSTPEEKLNSPDLVVVVSGGARWRLTLHEDGRWDVAGARISEKFAGIFSGNGGVEGVRWAATDQVERGDDLHRIAGEALWRLADVAESGRAA